MAVTNMSGYHPWVFKKELWDKFSMTLLTTSEESH